jgi:hypothetical protein
MPGLYPNIEPYEHGMLDVGDGYQVYWETCGNPSGKPALVLHGGPGSGCSPGSRRPFDPNVYRIVLFDQRGSGRSTPHASEPNIDLSANTTAHLLADIELLRRRLDIERVAGVWRVLGIDPGARLRRTTSPSRDRNGACQRRHYHSMGDRLDNPWSWRFFSLSSGPVFVMAFPKRSVLAASLKPIIASS